MIYGKGVSNMHRTIRFRAWHKNNKSMCQNIRTDLLDKNYLEFMQYTELNDVNGHNIYEGDIVHQESVKIDSPIINFTGEVKFYNGSWWIDNGEVNIYLFNESCKNRIVGNRFEGIKD